MNSFFIKTGIPPYTSAIPFTKEFYNQYQKDSLQRDYFKYNNTSVSIACDIHTISFTPNEQMMTVVPFFLGEEPLYVKVLINPKLDQNREYIPLLRPLYSCTLECMMTVEEYGLFHLSLINILDFTNISTINKVQYCDICKQYRFTEHPKQCCNGYKHAIISNHPLSWKRGE